jgi:hypothetical protein
MLRALNSPDCRARIGRSALVAAVCVHFHMLRIHCLRSFRDDFRQPRGGGDTDDQRLGDIISDCGRAGGMSDPGTGTVHSKPARPTVRFCGLEWRDNQEAWCTRFRLSGRKGGVAPPVAVPNALGVEIDDGSRPLGGAPPADIVAMIAAF